MKFFNIAEKTNDTKSTNELVQEIHDTFYTEVDKLLADAKISRSLDTDKQELIDKCKRLKDLGFTNTKEVIEADIEIKRLEDLETENKQKENLIHAINHFSFKYPQYKFITEDSVLKICNKYGLVYGAIKRFIGDVPEKNLKHIEQFSVDVKDECFISGMRSYSFRGPSRIGTDTYITNKEHADINECKDGRGHCPTGFSLINMKCPLEIAAPVKDFNMDGMEVKDFKISKIEIPDPVVLKPVIYSGEKYYLIVTAWGEEASDEIVVNSKMN